MMVAPSGVSTTTYSYFGLKEMARLAGMVQGVVVQIRAETLRPASAGSSAAGSPASLKRT
jgi:hypothetical protein